MHPCTSELMGIEFTVRLIRTGVRHAWVAQVLGNSPTTRRAWQFGRSSDPPGHTAGIEQIRPLLTGDSQGGSDVVHPC